MFTGFRPIDLLVLAVIALLIFGPKRLPEMGSAIGKTIKEFQKSMREVTHPTEQPMQSLPSASAQPAPAPQVTATTAEAVREPISTSNATATADHSND